MALPFDTTKTRAEDPATPTFGPVEQTRFVPGALLARRYRIVGLLGKGGMGEVYRADDLKLGKPVALKFLPEALAKDPAWLARFHNEVRTAREVTHPNVCRVHDIGEADDQHFLSMEYVDGEDLASLLTRIGRLPKDKGIEIARQLCAGLAAAHERGVLHRDLKPANVMIDGRGKVRITDFGLAGVAEQIQHDDMAAGTPAYMAPEQFAGREVTVRSDLYSLGLVLYEAFTGKRPFEGRTLAELARAHQSQPPPAPSDVVRDIDAAVERIVLRCLEKDPQARPPSAVAVSAALPGGDPLAAALAAGVTPSPEMVAAAGATGGLRPAVAWIWLASVVVTLSLTHAGGFASRMNLVQRVPLERSPQVLADRAHEILVRVRGSDAPVDKAYGLEYGQEIIRHITQRDPAPSRWDGLATGQPAAIYFWYRESPEPMSPSDGRVVTEVDPPLDAERMVLLNLDTRGRLIELHAVSPRFDDEKAEPPSPDWGALFAEAGLDISRFRQAQPVWVPSEYADARSAWDGAYSDRPEIPLHVEAAAYRGRPVYFELCGPWKQRAVPHSRGFEGLLILKVAVLSAGAFLARHNLRLGRGDRRGATRLAALVFGCEMLRWLVTASHVTDPYAEWVTFTRATASALFSCATYWLYYVALEPYARRLWPETLVSWSRLLTGRPRDPLVGRDILIGLLTGLAMLLLAVTTDIAAVRMGAPPLVSTYPGLDALVSVRLLAGGILSAAMLALQWSFLPLVLLLLLRIVVRARVMLAPCFLLVQTAVFLGMMGHWLGGGMPLTHWFVVWLFGAALSSVMFEVVTRVGLLAMMAMLLPFGLGAFYPAITPSLSAWHAGTFLVPVIVLVALAVYGFHTALAGRPLFKDEILPG
jgi:serine/threonine-protein kinase